jgi:transposase-like protein
MLCAGSGGQQRYVCVDCGKHYTTSYNVRMHRNIHIGRNLYNCKFCYKEFSHKHVWEVRGASA